MRRSRARREHESLVGAATIAALVLIGIIAVLELGPPQVLIYTGATPFNSGLLGTSYIYAETRSRYPNTFIVINWSRSPPLPEGCRVAVLVVISPEIPYSGEEANAAASYLSRCSERGVLAADESGNVNQLLQSMGSSVRVAGDKILDVSSRLPYPAAVFNTSWGYGGELILDIASSLSALASEGHSIYVIGVVPAAYLSNQSGDSTDTIFFDVPVAFEDVFGNTTVIAVGDGSIFLNQVMQSAYNKSYLELYTSALDHLCRHRGDCYIVFDATRYIGGDPVSIIMRGVNPALLVTPEFIASAIARILHPATWLPPAVSWVDSFIRSLTSISNLARILVVSTSTLIISLILLSKTPPRRVDSPIASEEDLSIVVAEGRMLDLARRPSIGRGDFLRLYKAIDEIVYRAFGVRLASRECSSKLAGGGVDTALAKAFCSYMARTGRRASLRSVRPLLVRWDSAVERALELYFAVSDQADLRRLSS